MMPCAMRSARAICAICTGGTVVVCAARHAQSQYCYPKSKPSILGVVYYTVRSVYTPPPNTSPVHYDTYTRVRGAARLLSNMCAPTARRTPPPHRFWFHAVRSVLRRVLINIARLFYERLLRTNARRSGKRMNIISSEQPPPHSERTPCVRFCAHTITTLIHTDIWFEHMFLGGFWGGGSGGRVAVGFASRNTG